VWTLDIKWHPRLPSHGGCAHDYVSSNVLHPWVDACELNSAMPMSTANVYDWHISILLCIYVCKIIAFVNFQEIKEIFIYLFCIIVYISGDYVTHKQSLWMTQWPSWIYCKYLCWSEVVVINKQLLIGSRWTVSQLWYTISALYKPVGL